MSPVTAREPQTANELLKLIDRYGVLPMGKQLAVDIRVVDARLVWGRVQVKIEPLGGSGQEWVNLTTVHLRELY